MESKISLTPRQILESIIEHEGCCDQFASYDACNNCPIPTYRACDGMAPRPCSIAVLGENESCWVCDTENALYKQAAIDMLADIIISDELSKV
jgi:hypothetical protein